MTVRFLDDRYHGQTDGGRSPEWPPSPLRLFQALVAANCGWSEWADDRHGAALRWLGGLPPPTIQCPEGVSARETARYVKNNNGNDDQRSNARRVYRPTLLRGGRHVHYVWRDAPGADYHLSTLCTMARRIHTLGWGVDTAIGDAHSDPVEESAQTWVPTVETLDPTGSVPVPDGGTLGRLQRRHAAFCTPVAEGGSTKFPDFESMTARRFVYRERSEPPPVVHCLFDLLDEREERFFFRPQRTTSVAAMVRHQAILATRSDYPADRQLLSLVSGHEEPPGSGHLAYLPVPTIGLRHGGGRIGRVIVAALMPPSVSPPNSVAKLWPALSGRLLEPEQGPLEGATVAHRRVSLLRSNRIDPTAGFYLRRSHTWATVTPVILPGYDDRRRTKTASLLGKAFDQAGLSMSQIEDFWFQQTPLWPNTLDARRAFPPTRMTSFPRYHVRVRFKRPLPGPISVGSGKFYGFGLFAGADESEIEV